MNKLRVKKFAIDARKKLIASVTEKAKMEMTLDQSRCEYRRKLAEQIGKVGLEAVAEEVACTWFSRICAVRFLEVNGYLPSGVRVLSSEQEGKSEPDIVTAAPEIDPGFTEQEKKEIIRHKAAGDTDWLFRRLFIRQCDQLSEILPELFGKTEGYAEILFDVSYTDKDDVVQMLTGENGVPEADFDVKAGGQVEIIGWLYQYYNEERKKEIVSIYNGTVKKEDLPVATQMFTPDWVVRYMVDNSLGRYWIERNPDSKLREKLEFFVAPKNGEIRYVDEKTEPAELTFIDPCMGSGHILVYAFDVLMEIYRECGYSDGDAALSIVKNNLFGLDIDRRACRLACFAIMMKARSYHEGALAQGVFHNLCEIQESNDMSFSACEAAAFDERQKETGKYLIDVFRDAKETGSLIRVESRDYGSFAEELLNLAPHGQQDSVRNYLQLARQAAILSRKYCVAATNPPYLGKMEGELKKFVAEQYKEYSGDLFAAFMYRNFQFCAEGGYSAFMTPFVWMYIKTYEKIRTYIIEHKSIMTLVQMEYSAFEEATVPVCSFVLKNGRAAEKSLCIRLSDFRGGMEVQKQKVLEAIRDAGCKYFYEAEQNTFSKIPGSPVAYWAGGGISRVFERSMPLASVASPRQGLITGDVSRFVRKWYECFTENMNLSAPAGGQGREGKWFPYCNGGEYRKWYGNNEDVVNWYQDGVEVKNFTDHKGRQKSRPQNRQFYFHEGATWSAISSSFFSVRYFPDGFLFSNAGMAIYADRKRLKYLTGFLNSKLSRLYLGIFNESLNYNQGDIAKLPIIIEKEDRIVKLTDQMIRLSKEDWDFFETSWDFRKHPLICCDTVEEAYKTWKKQCNQRFEKIRKKEEELNRIFIEIYGLQNELTPEVEDQDITVRKADLQRDIRSLVSYAVGCMFGRYSLDVDGVAYAGGGWDSAKYISYIPDADNIILITDEEHCPDDMVCRFCEWVKAVYGEDTLEENLDFIARALGNRGRTSRAVIRNYFLRDFMKDHIKIYRKRPIYWLFDSGKANGFKALIYMHRYDPDTVGTVRTKYLYKVRKAIEQAMERAEYLSANGSGGQKAKAARQLAKYEKQLAEIRIYDRAMAHAAAQRTVIDPDDGVKVNYAKFQGVEAVQEGEEVVRVDLLAKV